jgi:hypothetical protein
MFSLDLPYFYPGYITSQLIACYGNEAGLYLATHDGRA